MLVTLAYQGSADKDDYDAIKIVKIPKGQKESSFRIKTKDDDELENLEYFIISIEKILGGGFENVIVNPKNVKTDINDNVDISNAFKKDSFITSC